MKIKYNQSTFDCPLTKRGYLLENAYFRVTRSNVMNPHDLPMMYIASILYLYGSDFSGIYPGFKGKIPKGFDDVTNYHRTPSIHFSFYNEPIIRRKNEVEMISNEIIKNGYDFWYPYISWATPTGKKIRSTVNPTLEKQDRTPEMISWNKKQAKLIGTTKDWCDDFSKIIGEKYDFKFKFDVLDTDIRFTIVDNKLKKLNSKQISSRQKEYSKLFNDFAEYLYKGFLSNGKGFPKCLYE